MDHDNGEGSKKRGNSGAGFPFKQARGEWQRHVAGGGGGGGGKGDGADGVVGEVW